MKKRPEVIYVRSGYSPLRKPKVSTNSQVCVHEDFSLRVSSLFNRCKEIRDNANGAIVRARASVYWRKAEEDRIRKQAEERAAVKAAELKRRKAMQNELQGLLAKHASVMKQLREMGIG